MSEKIQRLALPIDPTTDSTQCHDLYERFSADPDLLAIPVLAGRSPVGLVNREDFMVALANKYGRALYEGKPVSVLMDARPLIVEGYNSLDFVSQYVASERPSALLKGFIITLEGAYIGVVSGLSLVQATTERLRRQTIELEEARAAAEDASRAKSTFLATVSHELRTPLNAIIGFATFMLSEPYGPVQPDRYGGYVKDIATSGEHLLRLINDILDMSRIEAGRLELRCSLFDPIEVVVASLRMLRPQIDKAGHNVTLDLDDKLGEIRGDDRALKQIFVNLLANAIKFTPPGGRISVHATAEGPDHIRFDVRDSGIGMAADQITTALKPFGQIDSSLSRQHAGTGLGLPLVLAFVEAHGGNLQIDSKPSEGTRISVILPRNLEGDGLDELDAGVSEARASA
ncbi:sensor histidine kinase [Govanella unica]|uniref:histidine kinase n=1 Tax=Govanella unica TaxID=2975056 RepID=A0A9X3TZD7_9PROT|nr:ATP-binding protein [Govania unica]MDA5194502.1 ATP-binding protein [Govania unica]